MPPSSELSPQFPNSAVNISDPISISEGEYLLKVTFIKNIDSPQVNLATNAHIINAMDNLSGSANLLFDVDSLAGEVNPMDMLLNSNTGGTLKVLSNPKLKLAVAFRGEKDFPVGIGVVLNVTIKSLLRIKRKVLKVDFVKEGDKALNNFQKQFNILPNKQYSIILLRGKSSQYAEQFLKDLVKSTQREAIIDESAEA